MITIQNVTPSQFAQLQVKLAVTHAAAITEHTPTTGAISGHGVSATYVYVPLSQMLTVEIGQHPWYVSEGAIESNIRKALCLWR